jgi:fibronectin-binding autotransporter adhesin
MKTQTKILRSIVALSACLAVTSGFSQSTYVWTNQNPQQLELSPVPGQGAGDLNQGTNWMRIVGPSTGGTDANGTPRPDFQDTVIWGDEMQFDGRTTGPVIATQDGGAQANGAGSGQPYGLHIHLTANQTSPVTLYTRAGGASGGMRMNSIQIDAGAGQFSLGSNSLTGVLDIIGGVLNGQIFTFTNNATASAVINPDTRYRMGGAGAHPFIFSGSGDWIVNNHMRSANSSAIIVQKFGSGTMTWTGTNVDTTTPGANWGDQLGTPITIGEGTMIWKTSDLVSSGTSGNPNIVNNATWKYDVQPVAGLVTGPGQVVGTISGTGSFEVHAGTLTLRGANTFSGPINLTGGELIAGSTENVGTSGPLGQGGIISFSGGTLGWSLANAFDYSSRFSTAPNQVYNLDTGGSSPTFATGLSSTGGSLNKLGGGTLTLAGPSTYTGPTTVAASGALVFQGTKSGSADITVADTATLGVFENGSQITPTTLTVGTSTGATLEFNNVTNHTVATLAPNNLVSAGTITINVNSGRFILIGETFALLKWTSGTAPATTLGFLAGAGGHLSTNGNEIDVVIDNPPYIWTGLNNASWDTTSIDWVRNALPATWVNGNFALLDDSSAVTNITISGTITPTNVTINSSEPYALTNSPGNVIGGGGGLTKSGNGSLVLPGGANTYTGVTTLGGGLVDADVLANGGTASDIGAASSAAANIVFSGGTLLYTGPGVSVDRLFTVGPGGGTIDNESFGQLAFTNTGSLGMSGNGPRTLTLTGPGTGGGDTLACNLTNHPAGTSLTKNGAGLWILTGTNTYAGGTTLLQGSLQIGAGPIGTGGPSGAIGNGTISTVSGTSIDFLRSGTLTVPGAIHGPASVTLDGSGTVILANNNGYTGGTTINTGTLQVGNGGGAGSLFVNGPIINNSLLVFNTAGSFVYQGAGIISGSGNVIFQGGGTIKAIGNNSYSGWTRIDSGTTFFCREGQDGALTSSAVTNNGTLRIVDQNNPGFTYTGPIVGSGKVQIGANNVNIGSMSLTGSNSYTGGTFIGDNTLVLGDGSTVGSGAILGNVQFVNNFTIAQDNPRTLTFNRPTGDDFTFGGTITTNFASPQGNLGIVQLSGGATVTLTGNNTYGGGTVVNGGALVIGNGGSSGSVGFGTVALNSGNPLVINRTGNLTISDNISGTSAIVIKGGPTVTLKGVNNTYTGATTVSNGTLIVAGTNATSSTHVYVGGLANGGTFISGPITLEPGTTLVANGSVGPLTIMSDFTNDASAMIFEINKLASPSNDMATVSGNLVRNATGGTLTVKNLGPNNLVPGDTFTLFSQPLPNGASVTVSGARATWVNNLAVDGSVSVATVITTRPTLNFTNSSTNIFFSWSDPYNSFKLQAQTNRTGISTNWADYPGGTANPISVPIVKTNVSVFYRIVSIP